jgi:hypothetical protein
MERQFYMQQAGKSERQFYTRREVSKTGSFIFLLLAFPFGLLYFLLTIIGLSFGISTFIIWLGLPILFGTLLLIRGMAAMERNMVSNLLNIPLPSPTRQTDGPKQKFWQQFGNVLRDPVTWTSLIYMIIKLPLGIISFTLTLTLSILSLALTAMPVVYLINLFVNSILLKNGIDSSSTIFPNFIEIHTYFDPLMFARTFIFVPVGLLVWWITWFLLSKLAYISGELARAMLCSGSQTQQEWASPKE